MQLQMQFGGHHKRFVSVPAFDKQVVVCRYEFFDIYKSEYMHDDQNFDFAIVTLQQPVGYAAGWMGVQALPPLGWCDEQPLTIPKIRLAGYPVQTNSTANQFVSTCQLQVRCPAV